MPTQGEFEAMSSNCSLSYNSGFIFTGKDGYSSAKVSFPGGEYFGPSVTAQYWTSSVGTNNGNVYYGDFTLTSGGSTFFSCNNANKPVDNNGTYKYFVRAVLR